MTGKDFEAFQRAWENVPSQDNEGFIPDRAGFKCGWVAALRYRDEEILKLREELKWRKGVAEIGTAICRHGTSTYSFCEECGPSGT